MRTLRDAKVGETVRISKLHGEGAVKRRIMDMGITKELMFLSVNWLRWGIRLKFRLGATSFLSESQTPK